MKQFFNTNKIRLVAVLVILLIGSVLAANLAEVRTLLSLKGAEMSGIGYVSTHQPTLRSLPEGYYFEVSAFFKQGTPYSVAGVCDSACSDLDIQVFDPKGNLVAEDTAPDDQPQVNLEIYRSVVLKIRVLMESCTARNCAAGLAIYGR